MQHRSKRLLTFFGLAVVGAAASVMALRLGLWVGGRPGGGLLPSITALGFTAIAVLCALREWTRREPANEAEPIAWRKLLSYIAALAVIAVLLEPIGYLLTVGLAFVFILRIAESKPWRLTLLVTTGTLAASAFLFEYLLGVDLPHGSFW